MNGHRFAPGDRWDPAIVDMINPHLSKFLDAYFETIPSPAHMEIRNEIGRYQRRPLRFQPYDAIAEVLPQLATAAQRWHDEQAALLAPAPDNAPAADANSGNDVGNALARRPAPVADDAPDDDQPKPP